MGKAFYLLLICTSFCSIAGAVDCETLKKQKFKVTDSASIRLAMVKFKSCGYDTIDLYYTMPPLVNAFLAKLDINDRANITYGDVFNIMQITKKMPQYAEQKAKVKYQLDNPRPTSLKAAVKSETYACDTPTNGYWYKDSTIPALYDLGVYFDYRQGWQCAKQTNKKFIVYFSAINCANCREMENSFLADERIMKKLKEEFIMVILYTDSRQEGETIAAMQPKQFNSNTQPAFYRIDKAEKRVGEILYDTNAEHFLQFLNKRELGRL